MSLLERLMITLLAVLVLAVLVGTLKSDMERTVTSSSPLPLGMQVLSAHEKKRPLTLEGEAAEFM